MTQKGGSRRKDSRISGVVEITPEFGEIDALWLALQREKGGKETSGDKKLIAAARRAGRNLDEISGLTPEGIAGYLKSLDRRSPRGNNRETTKRILHIPDHHSVRSDQRSSIVESNGSSGIQLEANTILQDVEIEEGNPGDFSGGIEPMEQIAGIVRGINGSANDINSDMTVFSFSAEGGSHSHEQEPHRECKEDLRLNYSRPSFGKVAVQKVSYLHEKKIFQGINPLEPAPDAENKPFYINLADFVRQDTGVVVYLGESTGFNGEQEREFVTRVFVVGAERSSVRGERG